MRLKRNRWIKSSGAETCVRAAGAGPASSCTKSKPQAVAAAESSSKSRNRPLTNSWFPDSFDGQPELCRLEIAHLKILDVPLGLDSRECWHREREPAITSNSKPRRGRPPEPVGAVRSHRVVSYLTSAEFQALSLIAEREGKSLSAVIHEILLTAVDQRDPGLGSRR